VFLSSETALGRADVLTVRRRSVSAKIEAGAESSPDPREDDHPAREIDSQLVEVFVKQLNEFARHGVEPVGSIESKNRHVRTRAFEEYRNIGHCPSLPVARSRKYTV
jgi:hypothetical protein